MRLQVKRLEPEAPDLSVAYLGDAGIDLPVLEDATILIGTGRDVRSGWAVAIPEGYYGRIVGRSSTLRKKGLLVVEGIIDAGFRGELYAFVWNPGPAVVTVAAGSSLAQLIVSPVASYEVELVNELSTSERGERGFGSSGR